MCVYTRTCTLGPYFPAALRLSQTSLSVSAANPATEADNLQFSFSMSAAKCRVFFYRLNVSSSLVTLEC